MVVFPNAKINIGLNILRKRPDGYHDIETLFYPVGLRDALEYVINGSDKLHFTQTGADLGIEAEKNIVVKAYRLLQQDFILPGLDIHLHKAIPQGAGLGGGSADAAFFLKSMNEYLDLGIAADRLKSYAAKLGADCAFFLTNAPSIATGTGEFLVPSAVSLQGKHLLLVKPPFGSNTAAAYAGVSPKGYPYPFRETLEGPVGEWRKFIKNDFEYSLFKVYPELGNLRTQLYHMGAVYAAMSGSGSAMFGIFDEAVPLSEGLFPSDYFIWQEILG